VQYAYTAVKLAHSKPAKSSVDMMNQVTLEIRELEGLLKRKPCDDANSTRPPGLLDLTTGRAEQDQCDLHPLFDHLLRTDDISGLEGAAVSPTVFTPIDYLRIPQHVTSYKQAVLVMRQADHLCLLTENQKELKFRHFLKVALLQHLFTNVIPVPLGPESRKKFPGSCIWETPMTYGEQLDTMFVLWRLMEQFTSAVCSLHMSRSFHTVRIVITGAIAAIADCVLRRDATDMPSDVSTILQACPRAEAEA
jgi:hypothetical protein